MLQLRSRQLPSSCQSPSTQSVPRTWKLWKPGITVPCYPLLSLLPKHHILMTERLVNTFCWSLKTGWGATDAEKFLVESRYSNEYGHKAAISCDAGQSGRNWLCAGWMRLGASRGCARTRRRELASGHLGSPSALAGAVAGRLSSVSSRQESEPQFLYRPLLGCSIFGAQICEGF